MRDDWYCTDDSSYYLHLAGTYYKRTGSTGWQVISQEQTPEHAMWSPVHPTQWETDVNALIAQGLLTGDEWWMMFRRSGRNY